MARYQFFNINPLGSIEEDCVCRAISLALNESYYTIQDKLELVGKLFDCEQLCVCCYKYLLDEVYGLERIEEMAGMTVDEFGYHCPQGIYLIRIDNHLTCMIDSVINDIWDCRDKEIRLVWKVS